ncbi:hypothetical protein SAMN05216289_11140 [Dokdonella immobilis]|uniref:Uncharacterized protein n=1 Tax=Dokdonella immobilis TaxID=578942 RepID=A0A1I4XQC8_9GAMM|nr:hypothetical protein SAMN05216289_11140 [Dokdonella immobilis]
MIQNSECEIWFGGEGRVILVPEADAALPQFR